LCEGGTTTVTYVVNDLCEKNVTKVATFSITKPDKLEIFCPGPIVLEPCANDIEAKYSEWKKGFYFSGGCNAVDNLTEFPVMNINAVIGGTITFTYVVTSMCDEQECTATFTVEPCAEFCTYTQGKYGNQYKSTACDLETRIATSIFVANLLDQGPLKIGNSTNYVLFQAGDAAVINSILPGGSGTAVLSGACTPTASTTPLKDKNYLTKQGKLSNGLLAQTLTLGLNLRINNGLTDLALQSGKYLVTQKKVACEKESGVVEPVCVDGVLTVNPYWYGMLDGTVVNYLMNTSGYSATVGSLYKLANDALGGMTLPSGLTLGKIMSAVDLINNAFDECRAFVGYWTDKYACPTLSDATITSGLEAKPLKVYPNPFNEKVTFEFVSNKDTQTVLEITNIVGQKITTLFNGPVKAGELNRIEYNPVNVVPGVLIYQLIMDGSIQNGRVVYQK
jgi:hypothetical protein